MRRRTLLGGGSIDYVFSAERTYDGVGDIGSYINVKITSTANGSNIGYSVVSYDGTVVTAVTTAATSVSIYYSTNSTYDPRAGSVVLKQDDSDKTITFYISQYAKSFTLDYSGILLDGGNGSSGSIYVGSDLSFINVPSWANAIYSDGNINVTATSANSASTARLAAMTVSVGSQSTSLTIIQLPSDYHSRDYVSMGGTNWAIKNVRASSVQGKGYYYMYGKGANAYSRGASTYTGTENPLASSADTATQVMGSGWRMPTLSECQALANNSYYWVSYNGVDGGVFDSSGNVLFIPAAGNEPDSTYANNGHIWSSTPNGSDKAYYLYVAYGDRHIDSYGGRQYGYSVRGVHA